MGGIPQNEIALAHGLTETAPGRLAIRGPMSSDPDFPGDAAYSEIRAWVEDQKPDAPLIFDFDSPGGDVYGVEALAKTIAEHPGPTTALVTGTAASAAYWLASSCDRVVAWPSATIGSIGAMLTIAADDDAIVDIVAKLTPRKNADKDDQWQSLIDASAERFLRHVASRRGWPDEDLKTVAIKSGEGKLMTAAEAKTRGLIDQVVEEGSMDPDKMPEVQPAEDEKSIDEIVVELREAVADHDRRIAELEAIVENLRREKDDEEADLAEETAEGEELDEKKKEEEMQAKCDRPRAASRQLAAMQRQLATMQRTQRDEVIARLRAEGRISATEIDIARNTYDTNRKLFDRVYGKPAAMSTPVTRISSAESEGLTAGQPSDPAKAAWAIVAKSGGKISYRDAFVRATGGAR